MSDFVVAVRAYPTSWLVVSLLAGQAVAGNQTKCNLKSCGPGMVNRLSDQSDAKRRITHRGRFVFALSVARARQPAFSRDVQEQPKYTGRV